MEWMDGVRLEDESNYCIDLSAANVSLSVV